MGEARSDPAPIDAPAPAVAEPAAFSESSEGPPPALAAKRRLVAAPESAYDGKLRPSDVLGNIECRMARGRGAAAGTALVTLPDGVSAKFSVVDGEGTVFGEAVPFQPNHLQLGRREDGVTLVALGDIRRKSHRMRPMDSLEPVHVYLGGQLIYRSDKVWDFTVARDASSFAIHEPSGAGSSRLVVRNLQFDEERHFDLGTRMTPTNADERNSALHYTPNGEQVAWQRGPKTPWSNRAYYFYPSGDGRTQRIRVENFFSSLVVSSGEGYLVSQAGRHGPGVWHITKKLFDTRAGTDDDAWRSLLDLTRFRGRLTVSDDGRFLGVHGWKFQVLDTKTGRTVFEYDTEHQTQRQMAVLSAALGQTKPPPLGRLTDITFRNGTMRFLRTLGSHDCSPPSDQETDDVRYRECLREHRQRGLYKTVADVYDLDTLAPNSQPMYREELFQDTDCMAGDAPTRGLQSVDGELAYLTEPRGSAAQLP